MVDKHDKPRERLIFDCPDRYKRALVLRQALDGKDSVGEVLLAMMDEYLADALAQIDRQVAGGGAKLKRGKRNES